jgi:DNA-binding NtrC family response regulator
MQRETDQEARVLDTSENKTDRFLDEFLPGKAESVIELKAQIAALNSDVGLRLVRCVLIVGESGCGKSHLAGIIAGHRNWRANVEANLGGPIRVFHGKFAEVHLPGLNDNLIESELFGHVKGAFTDARSDKLGYFGQGMDDILLDEIGDASPTVQAKLLRVIADGSYRPVGGVTCPH